MNCDFLALSSHKMGGPTGIGGLFVRPEIMKTNVSKVESGSASLSVRYCRPQQLRGRPRQLRGRSQQLCGRPQQLGNGQHAY